jgi:hypothetical protein
MWHYNGQDWSEINSGYGTSAIWGSSATDVYAAGNDGNMWHYDGQSWSKVDHGLGNDDIRAIWGSSANDVYAVGWSAIWHYDGQQWREVIHSLGWVGLEGIWGSRSDDIYVVGQNGTIWHSDVSLEPVAFGDISGQVTAETTGAGLGGISALAYPTNGTWPEAARVTTSATGHYTMTNLPVGDYRLYFTDPTGDYRAEYYNDQTTFANATTVTVAADTVTGGIDAALTPIPPPDTDVEGDVSVGNPPNSDEVVILVPRPRTGSMTLTQRVTCAGGVTPTGVTLLIDGKTFPMTALDSERYQVTLTVPADLPNLQGPFDMSVRYQCDGTESTEAIGRIVLYDPSGQITDAGTGAAITGAVVNLYRVPDAQPDSGTAQDGDCRTVTSLASAGETWSDQPAADLAAGGWLNPDLLEIDSTVGISPTINPQTTGSDGRYGWDVSEGCWYIAVSAEGYETQVSPLAGVPPEVTDLNIALEATATGESVYLPLVVK